MAKEIVKENYVPMTLFVGMGGIGSRIVKGVAEKCRGSETDNVNFVVLDTNVNDLSNVKKSGKQIYYVQTSNTKSVGDYLKHDKDAFDNWFPRNSVMYSKTVSEGAGQVRAISRLALNSTIKLGRMAKLYEAIDELFKKTGKDLNQALRVVFVASATGGTGSGMTLPLTMFIRNYVNEKYPNSSVIIRGMMLLPEVLDKEIKSTVEKNSLRRNAYATIKEINAFMMKGSGFFDNNPELQRYSDLHIDITAPTGEGIKRLDLLPFDFCFLFDGQNAEDHTLTNITQYEKQAAQCLYEQNIGPMQQNAFSIEDNIIKELSDKEHLGRNRFGGLGASVLRYPYDEVVKYISYQWAIDRIGGEGEAAKWSKYDQKYEALKREEKKKGLAESEKTKRPQGYNQYIKTLTDNFSKDLQNQYLKFADDEAIPGFLNDLESYIMGCVNDDKDIHNSKNKADQALAEDYNGEDAASAVDGLKSLRSFEKRVKDKAKEIASREAEAIFWNENPTVNIKEGYYLENALKIDRRAIHPNAMRYVLYSLEEEFAMMKDEFTSQLNDSESRLKAYSKNGNASKDDVNYEFDVAKSKKVETTIDELCDTFDRNKKKSVHAEATDKVEEKFNSFYKDIEQYERAAAMKEVCIIAYDYIRQLNEEFLKFYQTFTIKTEDLTRKQEDLAASLEFRKGDSYYNVCADSKILKEMADRSVVGDDDEMLSPELCANIFDAVKNNVQVERENRSLEVIEEDKSVDIFDDIMLDYFEERVREQCDDIDMNIIQAIAQEYRLSKRVKMREEQGSDEQVVDKVTRDDTERYIMETVARARRLAAPGIQRMDNSEPREINLCAYNKKLDKMRDFRVKDILSEMNASSTDTVSKYEIHFFNALYNLTPDKLSKFACSERSKTGDKDAGLYHKAYKTYSENIGPDSEKCRVISTHIDKRWESIHVMPEIDMDYQARRLKEIHQAFVYSLLYGIVRYGALSTIDDSLKLYRMENSDERVVDMIVSNGTPCDEFYEVLDHFYISSASVKDVQEIKKRKLKVDKDRNADYEDTVFAQALEEFNIAESHEGPTSLFEIPLVYYTSIPNTQRFDDEISDIVVAIIDIFKKEISQFVNKNDKEPMLWQVVKQQFDLMIANYGKTKKVNGNMKLKNNPVIDSIYRAIKNIGGKYPDQKVIEYVKKTINTDK